MRPRQAKPKIGVASVALILSIATLPAALPRALAQTAEPPSSPNSPAIAERLASRLQMLRALKSDLVTLQKRPSRDEFTLLMFLLEVLEAEVEAEPSSKSAFFGEWQKIWDTFQSERSRIPAERLESLPELEARFRLAFDRDLVKLSRLFARDGVPGLRPLAAPSSAAADVKNETARGIVQSLETRLERVFSTTGFRDLQDFRETLRRAERLQTFSSMIESENVSVAMNRSSQTRPWIMRTGFLNIHVTGTSGGHPLPETRNIYEANLSGVPVADYKSLDGDLKPKYAFLMPSPGSPYPRRNLGYGDDYYIFRLDRIRNRMAYTIGDSLEAASPFERKWLNNPEQRPKVWDDQFIPWSYRELMVPWLIGSEERGLGPFLGDEPVTELEGRPLNTSRSNSMYIEVQIFGSLTLEDVAAFVFTTREPQGEFLERLVELGIPIYHSPAPDTYQSWHPPRAIRPRVCREIF